MLKASGPNSRRLIVVGRYLLAPAGTSAALLARHFLRDQLGTEIPYITFFPAVVVVSALGGVGPGLTTVALSMLSAAFLISRPWFRFAFHTPSEYLGLALFVAVGCLIAGFQGLLARTRHSEHGTRLRYHQTLASIGDGVISTGADGLVDFMNPAAEQITGWRNAEARGLPISMVFRSADSENEGAQPSVIEQALKEQRTIHPAGQTVLLSKDGRRRPVDHSASPIRGGDGETAGAVLVVRDMTEQRAAEEALLQSRQRITEIFNSITDSFIALDAGFRFVYVNRAAERVLGLPQNELLGASLWDRYPEFAGGIVETEFRRALSSASPVHFENDQEILDGWYEFNAYPASGGEIAVYFRDITERKQYESLVLAAKQEAEQARDLIQTTLASIGDAVIATDAASRITFVNPVCEQLTGVPFARCGGRPLEEIFRIFDARSGDPAANPAATVLRENRSVALGGDVVLHSRDGRVIPIDDSAAPIRDVAGEVIGVVLVFRDVTEHRRTRAELERSENRLRLALEAGRIGVWDWDIPTNLIDWSERVYEIHGVPPGQFGGRVEDFAGLVHPDDQEIVRSRIQDALEGTREYEIEFRVVWRDAQIRWVFTSARVFRDDAGTPVRMLGATMDVTDRHEAEQALRDSESRLQMALEAGRMGTWVWDLRTNELSWSASQYRLLGVDPSDRPASYEAWAHSVHPEDLAGVERVIQAAAREHREYSSEYRVIWPDDSQHWVEGRGKFDYGPDGSPLRMVGVLSDITDRKRNEESLLRANEELQHFAFAASHDLQEPLRTINAFSQLLVRQCRDAIGADAEQYVRYIIDGTRRMSDLIQGLLELSRAGGVQTVSLRPVSCQNVVASTLETLTAAITEAGADIRCDNLPVVQGDPSQLAQLFQNLISNAIKYRQPGLRPEIHITAERSNPYWRFAVRDNGIGFSTRDAGQIFAPFKRLHGADVPGAGIGLALCRRIVQRHQGDIWAESQPGAGATFFFTLPAAEALPRGEPAAN